MTLTSALILNAYGLLLMLPVFLSFLVVASLPLGWHTYALPFVALGLGLLVMPFGFGNTYATRLVADLKPANAPRSACPVQLTLSPRLRSGARALLEDADDFGWLVLGDSHFDYHGDSLRLAFPLSRIARVQIINGGVRGLFIPSTRIRVTLAPGPDASGSGATPFPLAFDIAERSSLLLPTFRRTTRSLFAALQS